MEHVAYYRVSTDKQGQSGLGLEAQRHAVSDYLKRTSSQLLDEFTEVESGGKADRPALAEALTICRLKGATLIIAKLDRLARNVAFVSNLMESGVEFVAVDFPQANRLTVHILAAVAEHEREMISQRTKDALKAAKARGVRLGNPQNLSNQHTGRANGNREQERRATQYALQVKPVISDLQEEGRSSLAQLAEGLNDRGFKTRLGGRWHANSVKRLLDRL